MQMRGEGAICGTGGCTKWRSMRGKQAARLTGAQKCTSVYFYLIKPRRNALATAWVRFTASSFLVARFR
jgi:hypothetical protein